MEKEFVNYDLSLRMKALGFNEPCFGYYLETKEWTPASYSREGTVYPSNSNLLSDWVAAPTFQQAFRWFREKHGLYYHILPEFYTKGINFNWQIFWYLPKEEWTDYIISDGTGLYGDNNEYPTQEYAEIACLNELIKIVKNRNEQTN